MKGEYGWMHRHDQKSRNSGAKMTVSYVSAAMAKADFAALFPDPKQMPGQQGAKFNRLLMEGLAQTGIEIHACTGRPVTRHNCRQVFLPGMTRTQAPGLKYRYGAVLNLPVLKNLWQMADTYFAVRRDARQGACAVICDVLNASIALGAVMAAKHGRIPCIGLVTDLPELMVTGVDQRHVRMVRTVIDSCGGYVFLTEAMNDRLNPSHRPHVIIEGLCDPQMRHRERIRREGGKRKCLYAGLLDARYGVKMLVEGFLQAHLPDTELHLYGDGPYAAETAAIARTAPQIVFHGTVLNDAVVQAELEADLLINPRPTQEEFTRYSFPSKNMEYMATGTPVLTTCLPGMPPEYRPHVYLLEDETPDGVAEALQRIFAQPASERAAKGLAARRFVLEEKNNTKQGRKVLDLVDKLIKEFS